VSETNGKVLTKNNDKPVKKEVVVRKLMGIGFSEKEADHYIEEVCGAYYTIKERNGTTFIEHYIPESFLCLSFSNQSVASSFGSVSCHRSELGGRTWNITSKNLVRVT